jgi:hypothetical protein
MSKIENKTIDSLIEMSWIDRIAYFRTDAGQEAKRALNEAVSTIKSGIGEYLWIQFKEDLNDFDGYLAAVSGLMDKLKDGYLTDTHGNIIYGEDKKPIVKWLSNEVQYTRVLKPLAEHLNFSMEELGKLAARRDERKKKRVNYSGQKREREQFEGVKAGAEYAKHDNERAIAEAESKVAVITGKARQPRKYEAI